MHDSAKTGSSRGLLSGRVEGEKVKGGQKKRKATVKRDRGGGKLTRGCEEGGN